MLTHKSKKVVQMLPNARCRQDTRAVKRPAFGVRKIQKIPVLFCLRLQNLAGGKPVPISSPLGDLPLWGMEIDPEQARGELRTVMADEGGQKLNQVCACLTSNLGRPGRQGLICRGCSWRFPWAGHFWNNQNGDTPPHGFQCAPRGGCMPSHCWGR